MLYLIFKKLNEVLYFAKYCFQVYRFLIVILKKDNKNSKILEIKGHNFAVFKIIFPLKLKVESFARNG